LVIAGHDTTATTALWGLKLLTDNPSAQTRLRKALHAAYPDALSQDRAPSAQEIISTPIPYMDATLEEILRVGCPGGVVVRDATEDTIVLGHHIPKGTHVHLFLGSHGIREPAFKIDESLRSPTAQQAGKDGKGLRTWDDADVGAFKPERWLVPATNATPDAHAGAVLDGGRKSNAELTDDDYADNARWEYDSAAGPNIPFGLGQRGCFGRRLAYLSERLLFTLIIWHFELLKCPVSVPRSLYWYKIWPLRV
jgi:cytochrome P450